MKITRNPSIAARLIGVILALVALMAGAVAMTSPAQAVPAVKSMAAITPSGCQTNFTNYLNRTNRDGVVLQSRVGRADGQFVYSTSGASVRLGTEEIFVLDGRNYQITTHRWENSSGVYYGPGGPVGHSYGTMLWQPTSAWFERVSQPLVSIYGYDLASTSVAISGKYVPCPGGGG